MQKNIKMSEKYCLVLYNELSKGLVSDIIIPSSMDSGTAASDFFTPLCGLLSCKQVQLAA
jgi:hypothetical protein